MIAMHANPDLESRPSLRRMAKLLGTHTDTVQTAVDVLEEVGLIEVERGRGRRGNRYRLVEMYQPSRDIRERQECPGSADRNVPVEPPECTSSAGTEQTNRVFKIMSEQEQERKASPPVCVSKPNASENGVSQRLRQRQKANELLKDNGVWSRAIAPCVDTAAQMRPDGNPLPRIHQVLAMADRARPDNRPAWIVRALEDNWQSSRGEEPADA